MTMRTTKLRYSLEPTGHRPMYLQLRDKIIADIRLGRFTVGMAIPSISVLEEMTNASRVTIIRALNVLEEEGFIFPQHGKGYYVAARGQRALVAVVAPLELRTIHYSTQLLAGVELGTQGLGVDVLEAHAGLNIREFEAAVRHAIYVRGSRWLVLVPPLESPETIGEFIDSLKGDCRIVVTDRDVPTRHPVLLQDRATAYRLLAEHCIERGFKKAATFGFASHSSYTLKLLHKTLKQAGLKVRTKELASVDEAVGISSRIDVLLCADDFLAACVFDHFRGKSGHPRFALTGFNNTAHAHSIPGGLTTIDPNLLEMGRLAARMLAGDIPAEGQIVMPRLVVGASTTGWLA